MRALAIAAAVAATAIAGAASCSRSTPVSRVKSIEARIDGLTCPTCVPPLKASLTRAYKASAIDVDDDKDTARIEFAEHDAFSAAAFRGAVERANMRVVSVRMQACGIVESTNGAKMLTAGDSRFRVQSERDVPVNQPICADGTLDSRTDPAVFQVSAFSLQRENTR